LKRFVKRIIREVFLNKKLEKLKDDEKRAEFNESY
jgi:hypothetical protein